MSQHSSGPGESSSPPPQITYELEHLGRYQETPSSLSTFSHMPPPDCAAMGHSDSAGDGSGPPEPHGQRCALSCTECERREIRHARVQPCSPCACHKAQYVSVHPEATSTIELPPLGEKYVTRAEYNGLKARFEQLEQNVNLGRAPVGHVPQYYYPVFMELGVSPAKVSSSSPTHLPHPAGLGGHQMMLPTFSYPPPPPQPLPPHWYTGPDSPKTVESPRHIQHPSPGTMQQESPVTSPVVQAIHNGDAPSSSRSITSRQLKTNKGFPPSLVFVPSSHDSADTQSKNCQRRRTLGLCLRLVITHKDPVVWSNDVRWWMCHQWQALNNMRSRTCMIPMLPRNPCSIWMRVVATSLRLVEMYISIC